MYSVTRILMALVLLGLSTGIAQAQSSGTPVVTNPAATRIAWDHPAVDITGFNLYVDAATTGTPLVYTPLTDSPGSFVSPFPTLAVGNHQLQVSAVYVNGDERKSDVLAVRVIVVAAPANLRLVRFNPLGLFKRTAPAIVAITAVQRADGTWEPVLATGTARYRKA